MPETLFMEDRKKAKLKVAKSDLSSVLCPESVATYISRAVYCVISSFSSALPKIESFRLLCCCCWCFLHIYSISSLVHKSTINSTNQWEKIVHFALSWFSSICECVAFLFRSSCRFFHTHFCHGYANGKASIKRLRTRRTKKRQQMSIIFCWPKYVTVVL